MPYSKLRFTWALKGRSITTLTKFCPLVTTYPPPVDISEEISLLVGKVKSIAPLTFLVPPNYLVLQRSLLMTPYLDYTSIH